MSTFTWLYRAIRRHSSILLAGTLWLFMLPLHAAIPGPQCERPARLRFSVIPLGDSLDNLKAYQPLADALQQRLHIPVELVIPPSYGSVIEGLLSGAIDIARMGPASYISVHQSDRRVEPFATLVHQHDVFNEGNPAGYYSVLIARQNGPIASWSDLKGKKLSLTDPDSTSGASIPRHYFARLLSTHFDSFFARIAYSGTHEQSVRAVRDGEVDAAFVSSTILSALIASGKIQRQTIRVLWKSSLIPNAPFVYRGQLCANIKQTIRTVFFNQHNHTMTTALSNLHAYAFAPVSDDNYHVLRALP